MIASLYTFISTHRRLLLVILLMLLLLPTPPMDLATSSTGDGCQVCTVPGDRTASSPLCASLSASNGPAVDGCRSTPSVQVAVSNHGRTSLLRGKGHAKWQRLEDRRSCVVHVRCLCLCTNQQIDDIRRERRALQWQRRVLFKY